MAIYSCWIFDRHCNCVYSREWAPRPQTAPSRLFSPFSPTPTNTITSPQAPQQSISGASSPVATISTAVSNVALSSGSSSNIPAASKVTSGQLNSSNQNDNAKLLFGAIFSLRNIASKLYTEPSELNNDDPLLSPNHVSNHLTTFATNNYKVHYFETATNWKFALISDPLIDDLQFALLHIYNEIFNEHVVKNGLSQIDFLEGEYISNNAFVGGIDKYVTSLPGFA